MIYDVIIIGGGPSGLTAAIYTGRAKLKTLVLEKFMLGGQLLLTETIENFPGVYKMNSHAWIKVFERQLAEMEDVTLLQETKVKAIKKDSLFKVDVVLGEDNRDETFEARSLIISTGVQAKKLGIPGERDFTGRGVSYCGVCDGPLFKDKDIIIVGGGNTAIEEALYLKRFAKNITVVHRRDSLRAAALLQEKAKADEKITFRWNAIPLEVIGKMRLEGLKIKDTKTSQEETLLASGVFIFVGSFPDTDILRGLVDLNSEGFALADEDMASSMEGIFICGDCRKKPLRQIVTACSDGAVAANSVVKFLENKI